MAATADGWGEWMGGWKESEGQVDVEAERIDRQKAAMGGEMLGRMKDLNILILGARGVGVECAKNLILSNVGSVTLYDPNPTRIMDLGCNFYLNQDNVFAGTPRAEGCLPQLQTLNPYCKVEAHKGELNDEFLLQKNVLATGKPFGVVIVTDLLPRDQLFHINDLCRGNGMAFILGFNTGITASVFSDFGPKHIITDATGEPTQMLAVGNCEVIPKPPIMKVLDDKGQDVEDGTPVVVISVAQAKHGLDSGDEVVFDDMRGPLEILNGKQVSVKRCEFLSPREAKLDTNDPSFNEILKSATLDVMATFTKQYDHYKAEWEADAANADKKFPVREIQMFNRVAIVPPEGISAEQLAGYVAGGLMQQVRPPIEESYSSLKETLVQTKNPALLKGEDWAEGKGIDIHLALAATLDFEAEHKRWPALHNDDDATWVFERAGALSKERESVEGACWAEAFSWGFPSGEARDLDEKRIRRFAKLFPAELTGFCAYLGGVLAQEAVKRTGKFSPIKQWVHHEDTHLVTDESPTNVSPLLGTRYDWQVAVLGKDFQARAANQRVFLVGCGALGCEYLKGISLMGIGVGKRGKVWVTDMDQIEVSNLSRQFLFRSENVGQPKSVAGAAVVKGWNKALNIEALERKVGPDTEDFFSDEFWEGLDVCWNALDNVLARKYTDSRCLWYSKPLLESGTLGTKCNSEVILPFRSSTYNDGTETDDNENQIAMCTLRSFPYLPLHCIEFAKQAYFSDYFEFGPEQYDLYRSDKDTFFEQLDTMNEVEQMKAMSLIKYYAELQTGGAAIDFDACIRIAFDRLIKDFRTSVLDLIHQCDEMEKASGKVFWTGTKRKPRAVDWTSSDPSPMEYLYATANLFAHIWGVPYVRSRAEFQARVQKVGLVQPEWAPSGTKVMTEEDQADGEEGVSQEALYEVRGFLTELDVSKLQKAQAHDFEKDDDSNYHIDFLTIATNLRAWNYDIKASERHTVKVTAGKIIPALATTTAAVCGLVDIEFCKLVLGLQNLGNECFLNSNLNLSGSMMQAFQPEAPKEIKTGLAAPQSFTSWDKIIIDGEIPLKALIGLLEQRFGVKVTHLKRQGDQKTLFDAVDLKKLTWQITLKDGKVELSDDAIFTWKPQLRMARDMLSRLAADSGPAQTFKGQVNQAIAALEDVKASFQSTYDGPVSAAFSSAYRPSDDKPEDQAYFDTLLAARKYCVIEGYFVNAEGQDVTLPPIKYTFY